MRFLFLDSIKILYQRFNIKIFVIACEFVQIIQKRYLRLELNFVIVNGGFFHFFHVNLLCMMEVEH